MSNGARRSFQKGVNHVDKAIPEQKLREGLDRIVREVTENSAGIALIRGEAVPGDHICTVHVSFRQGFRSSLSIRADTALFTRLARSMLGEERVTAQDLEDVAKEYFNVLCGHIAAALYQSTRIAARFTVPSFHWGRYSPEDYKEQFVLRYSSGCDEAAELVHHIPVPRKDGGTKPDET